MLPSNPSAGAPYLPILKRMLRVNERSGGTCPGGNVSAALVTPKRARTLLWTINGAPHGFGSCKADGCDLFTEETSGRVYSRHLHAEAALIALAARSGIVTASRVIIVTRSPCPDCTKLIVASGAAGIVFPREASAESWESLAPMYERAGLWAIRL